MTTTTSPAPRTTQAPARHRALTAARIWAGLLGLNGLAGATFFILIAPEEAVWVGPWVDVPVVALMLTGFLLKLGVALVPGVPALRRIRAGLVAVALGMGVTLVKIPVYDEPEGVLFLALDAVLLGLLLLARRSTRARS